MTIDTLVAQVSIPRNCSRKNRVSIAQTTSSHHTCTWRSHRIQKTNFALYLKSIKNSPRYLAWIRTVSYLLIQERNSQQRSNLMIKRFMLTQMIKLLFFKFRETNQIEHCLLIIHVQTMSYALSRSICCAVVTWEFTI